MMHWIHLNTIKRSLPAGLAILLLVLPLGTLLIPNASADEEQPLLLRVNSRVYFPGHPIKYRYDIPQSTALEASAWIGLIPAKIPHGNASENARFAVTTIPLDGRYEGRGMIPAPMDPGKYDLRLQSSRSNALELTHTTFQVEPHPMGLSLIHKIYLPGDEMIVSFGAPTNAAETGWLGIVSSSVLDKTALIQADAYVAQPLERTTGYKTLKVPETPGDYEVRMYLSNNRSAEVSSVSFRVVAELPTAPQAEANQP